MLTSPLVKRTYTVFDPATERTALNRLLAAAVVNVRFRNLLLTNPAEALAGGFAGEKFIFSPQTQEVLLTIKSGSLAEFAQMLCEKFPELVKT
jgi:hypothetical protein